METRDVIVIGAGLAGCAAAAAARQAGASVLVIDRAPGATAFSSGALDLAGDPHPVPGRPDLESLDLHANINNIASRRPDHPYAVMTRGASDPGQHILSSLQEAVRLLFPEDGLVRLEGDPAGNRWAFTALGTVKAAALLPAAAARPDAPGMERPLVLGIRGLVDFAPEAWSKVATENAARLGIAAAPSCAALDLGGAGGLQTPAVAALIARDLDAFIAAVARAVAANPGVAAAVLPAIFPIAGRTELIVRLEKALSLPAYELLSAPPSLHGLRLREHLARRLSELGIERMGGRVTGFHADNDMVESLEVEDASGKRTLAARVFVLASGKFLAGGLEKGPGLVETVFNLPVVIGDEAADEVINENAFSVPVSGPHPLFGAGVRVNERLQPLGRDGRPVYQNLRAAGSIIAGPDYITTPSASGAALATGLAAGKVL